MGKTRAKYQRRWSCVWCGNMRGRVGSGRGQFESADEHVPYFGRETLRGSSRAYCVDLFMKLFEKEISPVLGRGTGSKDVIYREDLKEALV